MAQDRTLRADAARNRAKILESARELITRHGAEVSTDAIAQAAGVAAGTLYRHFPSKSDLISAALQGSLESLADITETAWARVEQGQSPAMEEFRALAATYVHTSAQDHAFRLTADRLTEEHRFSEGQMKRAADAGRRLVERAQQDGDMHPDVTIDDVYLLLHAAPVDAVLATRNRWLTLMLAGFDAERREWPDASLHPDR
ncbi:TetR/AcrR family transcriptional regulator [Streptomyces sp. NPDC057699]|uniref:TetR/AcrR family transcriptional regulator n=1 Tax=Streptomyces sp. NPDC057699 TaxID=3346220 RepID=UPI00367AA1C0